MKYIFLALPMLILSSCTIEEVPSSDLNIVAQHTKMQVFSDLSIKQIANSATDQFILDHTGNVFSAEKGKISSGIKDIRVVKNSLFMAGDSQDAIQADQLWTDNNHLFAFKQNKLVAYIVKPNGQLIESAHTDTSAYKMVKPHFHGAGVLTQKGTLENISFLCLYDFVTNIVAPRSPAITTYAFSESERSAAVIRGHQIDIYETKDSGITWSPSASSIIMIPDWQENDFIDVAILTDPLQIDHVFIVTTKHLLLVDPKVGKFIEIPGIFSSAINSAPPRFESQKDGSVFLYAEGKAFHLEMKY